MAETMYAAPGIGLAANQVGLLKRVIVMDCARDDEPPALWKMINPEIIWLSEENTKMEEGCLSIPGHNAEVVRPSEAHVSYLDIEGQKQEMQATGLLAACVQHEIDHLNGVLFLDHLSRLKRDMIMRKVIKENRTQKTKELQIEPTKPADSLSLIFMGSPAFSVPVPSVWQTDIL